MSNKQNDSVNFALSVDVEDYFQVWAFSKVIEKSSWDGFAPRVQQATRRVLDLFDQRGTVATFFVLGWIAERFPLLVREISDRGHEIASHGCEHAKVFDQTPAEFRDDARRSKLLLEDISGEEVIGYRAPGFSIDARTPWAHEILAEVGYQYSSSAHPIAHDHYGDANGSRTPFNPVAGSSFIEAPVATAEVFGRRVSCAGGGWFRAMPYGLSKALIERARSSLDAPLIFYFHPWEVDPGQPRIASAPLKSKIRHYLNLSEMQSKIERLLTDYNWGRIDDALGLHIMEAAA